MGVRDQIVSRAYGQLGVDYYSMNYSESEGFAGWMGTNYVGAGWGCAQLAAYCYNTVIGTSYVGSAWNFAGDALGQDTNQGGGQFVFTDDPQAGDVVAYIQSGCDGSAFDDYGHIAVCVGDGMVVGAMGVGKPYEGGYINIGVSETSIYEQDLGGGWRYLRCTRLADEGGEDKREEPETEIEEEDDMVCIFQPNDESFLMYYDGANVHKLSCPDEVEAIRMVYKSTHGGRDLPMFPLGSKEAPWATRFINAVQRVEETWPEMGV